jgi:hypothetical protein
LVQSIDIYSGSKTTDLNFSTVAEYYEDSDPPDWTHDLSSPSLIYLYLERSADLPLKSSLTESVFKDRSLDFHVALQSVAQYSSRWVDARFYLITRTSSSLEQNPPACIKNNVPPFNAYPPIRGSPDQEDLFGSIPKLHSLFIRNQFDSASFTAWSQIQALDCSPSDFTAILHLCLNVNTIKLSGSHCLYWDRGTSIAIGMLSAPPAFMRGPCRVIYFFLPSEMSL